MTHGAQINSSDNRHRCAIGALRTATSPGRGPPAETSGSRQSFGGAAAHAGGDMPRDRARRRRSFSAADLRPGRCGPAAGGDPDGARKSRTTGEKHTLRTVNRRAWRPNRRHSAPARRAARAQHTAREAIQRPPGRSATRGDCGGGTRWPAAPRHSRLAEARANPRLICNRPQPVRHRAHRRAHSHIHREHAPSASATSRGRPRGDHGRRVIRSSRDGPAGHFPRKEHVPVRGWIRAIRHETLNGREAANYAGCIRFAPVRVARISGPDTALAANRRPRWLNRAPGKGDPRTPTTDQARRPAPSGITR